MHLNPVIIGYINNRFSVPVDHQRFIPDSMDNRLYSSPTFIDLAVHDGNRLTQALLFENASRFFG